MQRDELEHQTKLTELDRIRGEIRKQLAQEYHWEAQRMYWLILGIAAVVAVIINGLKPLWSN